MEWEFEVWQDGVMVACGYGPRAGVLEREAMHYYNQYAQDGPCKMIFGRSPLPAPVEGEDT
jgi:hypothetical protein